LCGEANAKGDGIERAIDATLLVAVPPTVVVHFAALGLVTNKGKRRDKWPSSLWIR
jgi:hypothetical protein